MLKNTDSLWILVLLAVSCSTTQSHRTLLGKTYPPKPAEAEIEVFQTGQPTRPFERIARLVVHVEKSFFVSSSLENALPELKKQARLAGADAVIEIEENWSTVVETKIYNVTATGIRYTDPPGK